MPHAAWSVSLWLSTSSDYLCRRIHIRLRNALRLGPRIFLGLGLPVSIVLVMGFNCCVDLLRLWPFASGLASGLLLLELGPPNLAFLLGVRLGLGLLVFLRRGFLCGLFFLSPGLLLGLGFLLGARLGLRSGLNLLLSPNLGPGLLVGPLLLDMFLLLLEKLRPKSRAKATDVQVHAVLVALLRHHVFDGIGKAAAPVLMPPLQHHLAAHIVKILLDRIGLPVTALDHRLHDGVATLTESQRSLVAIYHKGLVGGRRVAALCEDCRLRLPFILDAEQGAGRDFGAQMYSKEGLPMAGLGLVAAGGPDARQEEERCSRERHRAAAATRPNGATFDHKE
mmetsp:Transcript_102118/g.288395  ORF Transcript_102118/g.288395 Transcript_102118/m.288395 type:complete len:337 (+) Transcript_102118:36-1046(+)